MRLWQRATGALKDRSSIWIVRLPWRSQYRNPDLEKVIIKATNHDEHQIDYVNVQRVIKWVKTSPLHLKPLTWALSMRMEKTKSWVVALKGIMLMHGIFLRDIPNVHTIGRLPFDLSNFCDGHSKTEKMWGFNAFIRTYFAYLDQKSVFVSSEFKKLQSKLGKETEQTLIEELEKLQELQGLIDVLLQIKPHNMNMNVGLILEAMNFLVDEVFDVHSKFYEGISRVLLKIYDMGGKDEAAIALKVLQTSAIQEDKLSSYFELCRDIGIVNASRYLKITRIWEEDIQELERIINGASEKKCLEGIDDEKAIVVKDSSTAVASISEQKERENGLKTLITDKWEVFEEDLMVDVRESAAYHARVASITSPSDESYSLIPYVPPYNQNLPDLISL